MIRFIKLSEYFGFSAARQTANNEQWEQQSLVRLRKQNKR